MAVLSRYDMWRDFIHLKYGTCKNSHNFHLSPVSTILVFIHMSSTVVHVMKKGGWRRVMVIMGVTLALLLSHLLLLVVVLVSGVAVNTCNLFLPYFCQTFLPSAWRALFIDWLTFYYYHFIDMCVCFFSFCGKDNTRRDHNCLPLSVLLKIKVQN